MTTTTLDRPTLPATAPSMIPPLLARQAIHKFTAAVNDGNIARAIEVAEELRQKYAMLMRSTLRDLPVIEAPPGLLPRSLIDLANREGHDSLGDLFGRYTDHRMSTLCNLSERDFRKVKRLRKRVERGEMLYHMTD